MKKIKHSKFRNTGLLFELLTRQITLEILNNSEERAKKIVSETFKSGTELSKELRLYKLLSEERYKVDSTAEKFVESILEMHNKLDISKLNSEKYNLVKLIRENFDLKQFLTSPLTNYKVLASIHKLFESKQLNVSNVKDVFDAKRCIVENLTSSSKKKDKTELVYENYATQDKDVRLLSYKILVETFNNKYSNLDDNQKILLREYINNVTNTSKFKDYFEKEIKSSLNELSILNGEIDDKITNIKLTETIQVLNDMKLGKTITDEQVGTMMLVHELIKELKNVKQR